jgi:hypothetical protein
VRSYLPSVADASRMTGFPAAGTPAGTVVIRAAGLRFPGGVTVTAVNAVPSAGEPAVFCRPVVTAPAVVRRDGTVLADAWLPDLVRLGELERHLGDGVIEAIVGTAVAQGRLKPRQRRKIMSYPLVIRLMIAMTLMPDASYCEALRRLTGLLADIPFIFVHDPVRLEQRVDVAGDAGGVVGQGHRGAAHDEDVGHDSPVDEAIAQRGECPLKFCPAQQDTAGVAHAASRSLADRYTPCFLNAAGAQTSASAR